MKGFVLDKAVLSDEEKQEILLAMQSLSIAQNNDEIIRKLSAIFNLNTDNGLKLIFQDGVRLHSDNKKFEQLKSAVIHQKMRENCLCKLL